MIDRSYLPFKSARSYVDRGMTKWMGFFISEHSTSLARADETIDYSKQMNEEEIFFLLGRSYVNNLTILLYTKNKKKPLLGNVYEVLYEKIYFKTENMIMNISFEDILKLELLEENNEK